MDADVMIKAEGLSKKFCRSLKRSMFYATVDIMRSMFGVRYDKLSLRQGEFLSLDNLSFEVKRGEALGIIGQNGSGKTTLLRLISGIFPPDGGSISTRGRMGALIAIGAGFHPHMTGRQNIYLNGTIIGMSRKEIDEKIAEIIAFADIGDFIDAPVYSYSSGMTVRLGFSIAIHANPDILLADEGLAVGDLGFVLKCYRKIAEYREQGGTIVLVSHNMHLIKNVCQKVLWLEKGREVQHGEAIEVCEAYENRALTVLNSGEADLNKSILKYDDKFDITTVDFVDESGTKTDRYQAGDRMIIKIGFMAKRIIESPIFSIALLDAEDNIIFECYSEGQFTRIEGEGVVSFATERLALHPNIYGCSITVAERNLLNKLEWRERCHSIVFENGRHLPINQGMLYPNPVWKVEYK